MNLLIDENRSPRLARWACEQGYPAEAAAHVDLSGAADQTVFAYAYRRNQVVVTVNVSDFMTLASAMELHPGVIALREAELTAQQQSLRLQTALNFAEANCRGDLLNRVLEVSRSTKLLLHTIPAEINDH